MTPQKLRIFWWHLAAKAVAEGLQCRAIRGRTTSYHLAIDHQQCLDRRVLVAGRRSIGATTCSPPTSPHG